MRTRFTSVTALAIAFLVGGCLAASPERGNVLHLPGLVADTSAAYEFEGRPQGIFFAPSSLNRPPDSGVFPDRGVLAVAAFETEVVGADGLLQNALKLNYAMHGLGSTVVLESEYLSLRSGLVAREAITVVTTNGNEGLHRGISWPRGAPDILMASAFPRTIASGEVTTRFFLPEDGEIPTEMSVAVWTSHVRGGEAILSLNPGPVLSHRGFQAFTITFDETCPFPARIETTREAGSTAVLQRIDCRLGVEGPHYNNEEPAPPSGVLRDWALTTDQLAGWDLEFDERFPVGLAVTTLELDSQFQTLCPCQVTRIQWATSEAGENLQWAFEFGTNDGPDKRVIVARQGERILLTWQDTDRQNQTTHSSIHLDAPAMQDGWRLLFGEPVVMDWNPWPSGRRAMVTVMPGERDLRWETGGTSGFPVYYWGPSGFALRYSLAAAWEAKA